MLLDTLNDELSKLSLSLFGERKEIRDAREYLPGASSKRESAPALPDMIASYDQFLAHRYASDLAYYDELIASRSQRPESQPAEARSRAG